MESHSVPLVQRFPNVFERNPNLSLVNISRPKPQLAYADMKKIMVVCMILAVRCYVRFQCQQSTLSLSTYATERHRQAVVELTSHVI